MRTRRMVLGWVVLAVLSVSVFAGEPPDGKFVSREEYEALLKDMQAMKAKMTAMEADAAIRRS